MSLCKIKFIFWIGSFKYFNSIIMKTKHATFYSYWKPLQDKERRWNRARRLGIELGQAIIGLAVLYAVYIILWGLTL